MQTLPQTDVSPLSPEQQLSFVRATAEAARFTRAAKVAQFNGLSMIILAVLCAPFGLMDVTNFIAAGLLGLLGAVELIGRSRFQRLNASAGRMLAVNQLVLLIAILAYCARQIYVAHTHPDALANRPELQGLGIDLQGLEKSLAWTLYASVAAASVLFQGFCAIYYLRTGRRIRDYVESTPDWIVDLLRHSGLS